ncbi:phage tail sheath subtilisin-like domain-containing protein [Herminiimonas contaminans]|uniref:Phage tail protein n=1 Tax=Herminiimonas contaminans TaxID=1111140 RepID=A0ABS0EYJ8_9BURK|nr:phage tail sheath subtilisin-like domain-containing protein [Herminiimonas contaminans]MBF8179658.1 phage tail protein [Herminiimonas contaminans]
MSDNVSFREIPDDIRVPYQATEISGVRADATAPGLPHKIVLVGQKLAAGTALPGVEVVVQNPDQVAKLAGRGSMLHHIAIEAKRANPYAQMTMVPVIDLPAGAAATGTLSFTGPATAAGTIPMYIDGNRIQVGVSQGDTAAMIAANVAIQINAAVDLPMSVPVAPTAGSVALVARHKGECGNDLDVRFAANYGESMPSGVGVTITAMNGGSGNPDVAPLLAAISGSDRIRLVMPWTDSANIAAAEADFDVRYGPMVKQESHLFACVSGSFGSLTTYGDNRNNINSTVFWREGNMVAPYRLAARAAGLVSMRGASDPARPYHGMVLTGIPAPAERDRGTLAEHNALLKKGISTFKYGAGGEVMIEMVCTTYKTNSFGMPTKSYFKINSKWGADYFRFRWDALIAQRYPDFKICDDDTDFAPGQPMVSPSVLRGEAFGLYKDLEYTGQVEQTESFKETLIMLRSIANVNQMNAVMAPNLVNQFDVMATMIEFIN